MNIESNKYQLIEDYLSGALNNDELDKFKAFLQSDADLREEVQISAELQEAEAFSSGEADLRNTLSQIRKDNTNSNVAWKYIVMALVLALTSFMLFKYFAPSTLNTQPIHLAEAHTQVEPLSLITKGANSKVDIRNMQDLFNAKEYGQALPLINQYLESHPKDMDVLLAKGIALMETDKFIQADKVFSNIGAMNPRVKKYMWYSAMSMLNQDKVSQASSILKEIVANKLYNYEAAEAVLDSI